MRTAKVILNEKLALVKAALPSIVGGSDVSDKFKVACFEETRRVLWVKND